MVCSRRTSAWATSSNPRQWISRRRSRPASPTRPPGRRSAATRSCKRSAKAVSAWFRRAQDHQAGMDTKQVIARFEAERQALAVMDHPCIARCSTGATTDRAAVLRHGARQGLPDHALLRPTGPADDAAAARAVPPRSATRSSTRTRRGSSTATSSRATSWLTLHDGEPVPKVIDFGIAKATSQRLTEKTCSPSIPAS
jgi:hypothetical protein